MSSYKPRYTPNYGSGGWREREALKEKQRKELEARKAEEARLAQAKMNEVNFPVLVQGAGNRTVQVGEQTFADLAEQWKFKDELTQMREEARKIKEEKERISMNGVFIRRTNYDDLYDNGPSKYDRYMPPEQPKTNPAFDGWHLVDTKKTKKEKKELTEAELYEKYATSASSDDEEDVDMNGHLFETNRHDHY